MLHASQPEAGARHSGPVYSAAEAEQGCMDATGRYVFGEKNVSTEKLNKKRHVLKSMPLSTSAKDQPSVLFISEESVRPLGHTHLSEKQTFLHINVNIIINI